MRAHWCIARRFGRCRASFVVIIRSLPFVHSVAKNEMKGRLLSAFCSSPIKPTSKLRASFRHEPHFPPFCNLSLSLTWLPHREAGQMSGGVPFPATDVRGKKSKKSKKGEAEVAATDPVPTVSREEMNLQPSQSSSAVAAGSSSSSTHFFAPSTYGGNDAPRRMDALSSADYDDDEEMKFAQSYNGSGSHARGGNGRFSSADDEHPLGNVPCIVLRMDFLCSAAGFFERVCQVSLPPLIQFSFLLSDRFVTFSSPAGPALSTVSPQPAVRARCALVQLRLIPLSFCHQLNHLYPFQIIPIGFLL